MKTSLLRLKYKTAFVGQGLAILAFIAFTVSLFLPVHWFTYPIMQKFSAEPMMYGWRFVLTLWGDMLLFMFLLIPSSFDIDVLEPLFFAKVYNIGNLLLILAPFLPHKLHHPLLRKIHLGIVFVCTLAAIAYKYVDDIQLGTSYYSGYYAWVLAYILLLAGSILILNKETDSTM